MLAAGSWALTLAFVAFALRAHLRLVLVARACHELRGPLFAVQLGLHGLVGDPARMAAIELELARAGRALDDLAAAPQGRRVRARCELVDLDALLESYAPAWRTLAAGYGATLRVEPPVSVRSAVAESRGRARPTPGALVEGRGGARPAPGRGALVDGRGGTRSPFERLLAPHDDIRPLPEAACAPPPRAPLPEATSAAPPRAPLPEATSAAPPRAPLPEATSAAPSRPAVAALPRALAPAPGGASPAAVFADPLRIAQACANLIANAAEHGGGEVHVGVRVSGARVRIEVADDGPGLPASVGALTASARTRRGRRGHGLAIAAEIAADQGGRLFAAPSDAGARLLFELPAAAQPPVAA